MATSRIIQKNNFYGGIIDDPRKSTTTECTISKHFDIFSQPNKLIPYRSLEADTNDGSTSTGMKQYNVKDFAYASASAKLYGLGSTAGGLTQIFFKADATTGNWTVPASSTGNGAVKNGCFLEYKNYMIGFQGTNQIFRWGLLSGTPAITNSLSTVASTITSVANGVIASDGNAYIAYNNVIVRISETFTVTDQAKLVPSNYKITALVNFGNYMAVGCSPVSNFSGQSKVFIWDLSDDTFFMETIDWGEGELRVLESIEGMLVGITDRYLNSSTGAGTGSMILQIYTGGSAQVQKEVFTQALVGKTIPTSRVVKNNRLFFAAKIMTNSAGTEYNEGIWSFGRKNANYPYTLSLDIIDENINTSGVQGFGLAGNFFFIAHSADGSIDKTDDTATFTFTSIYETEIITPSPQGVTNLLESFTIITDPIVTGTVTVKYSVDAGTSWITIGSSSTVGSVSRDFYNIESSGADFASFKEIRFRLESTGGAKITGYKFKAQELIGSN